MWHDLKLKYGSSDIVGIEEPFRLTVQHIVDLEIFVLENFRVLHFCVKIFLWPRIPTKIL